MIVVLSLAGRADPGGEAAEWLRVHSGRILLEYASSALTVAVLEADGLPPRSICRGALVLRVPDTEQAVRVARALIARPAVATSPQSRAAARRIPRAGRGRGCRRD